MPNIKRVELLDRNEVLKNMADSFEGYKFILRQSMILTSNKGQEQEVSYCVECIYG